MWEVIETSYLERARKLTESGYIRKWRLTGILYNIHGAYAKRIMLKEVKRGSKREREQRREEEEGNQAAVLDTGSKTTIDRTMLDEIEVHSFPHDKDDWPLVPLGMPRGYVAGALKAAARAYGTQRGQRFFGILAHIERGGIVIKPDWVVLKSKEEPTPIEYPTPMADGKTAQVIFFDWVKESPFMIEIDECATYKLTKTEQGKKAKDQTKEQPFTMVIMDEDDFLMLIGKISDGDTPIGPKGRGKIVWTKIEKWEKDKWVERSESITSSA